MTLPEFLTALENVHTTMDELRPKKPGEIVGEIAKAVEEHQKEQRKARGLA